MNTSTFIPSKPVATKSLLLVEGVDDKILAEKLLDSNTIPREHITIQEGKSGGGGYNAILTKIKEYQTVVSDYRYTVKKLFIAVDADDKGVEVRFAEIKANLDPTIHSLPEKAGQLSPLEEGKIQTAIYVFPNNKDVGIVEKLCLPTVKEPTRLSPIETFLQDMSTKKMWDTPENRKDKSRLQVYLATQPIPNVGLGQAVRYDTFDLTHANYHDYLEFLRLL